MDRDVVPAVIAITAHTGDAATYELFWERYKSAATPQEEGDEEDEAALAEIEEFIRVAALLLHGDCVLGPRHRRSMH